MRLALFEPDIAPNVGTLLRLCACLAVPMDIIEPCGFVFNDRKLRRAGMDYMDNVELKRHQSWQKFQSQRPTGSRLVLMTTKSPFPYTEFIFQKSDILLAGSEGAGVPDFVHAAADATVTVPMPGPMPGGQRSLNLAVASAMILGEALRQTAKDLK